MGRSWRPDVSRRKQYKQTLDMAKWCFGFACLMICIALVMANKP